VTRNPAVLSELGHSGREIRTSRSLKGASKNSGYSGEVLADHIATGPCCHMAFVCTLRDDFSPEIVDDVLIFRIGYDESAGRTYSVVMGLDPTPRGRWEFYFYIMEYRDGTNEQRILWSGRDTKGLIESEERQLVLDAVCKAIPTLLDEYKPDWVYRCTNDAGLSEDGLKKHTAIAEVFKSCGYEQYEVDGPIGHKAWWMERKS